MIHDSYDQHNLYSWTQSSKKRHRAEIYLTSTIWRPTVFVDEEPLDDVFEDEAPLPNKTSAAGKKPDSRLDGDKLDEVEDVDQSTATDSEEPLALVGLSGKDWKVRNLASITLPVIF